MKLEWTRPARRDLRDLVDHYDAIDPQLSARMLDAVEATPRLLIDYPKIGAKTVTAGCRKWRVRGTPYLPFYSSTRGQLRVLRVLHAARDVLL